MKKSFCTWYNYLYVILLMGIVCLACLLPYFIINNSVTFPTRYINYSFLFAGVVLVGVGFIWQDLYRGFQRHKINDWDNVLPQEIINKAWGIFMPFFTSGILSVITGGILCAFIK